MNDEAAETATRIIAPWIRQLLEVGKATSSIIDLQKQLIAMMAETYGVLLAHVEDIISQPEAFDLDGYQTAAQQWLLDIKRLEGNANELLVALDDLQVLERVLPREEKEADATPGT